jgi:hypothetical protein
MERIGGSAACKAEIRYRPPLLQRTLPVFAGLWVMLAIMALAASRTAHPLTGPEIREFITSIFVLTASFAYFTREEGVTLRPDGVVVHKTRKRVIEWRGVTDVSVEKKFAYRSVVVRDATGRRIRLPAPGGYLDHGFDDKARVIQSCWLGQHDWTMPVKNSLQV